MCCTATIVPVVLDGPSRVLDVGRAGRLATEPLRQALTLRDRGCVFPGCDAPPASCQAHHIRPWYAGGETCLENLVLVCHHHHGIIEPDRYQHRDQWAVRIGDDGLPEFIPPRRLDPTHTPTRHQRHQQAADQESGHAPTPVRPGEPDPASIRGAEDPGPGSQGSGQSTPASIRGAEGPGPELLGSGQSAHPSFAGLEGMGTTLLGPGEPTRQPTGPTSDRTPAPLPQKTAVSGATVPMMRLGAVSAAWIPEVGTKTPEPKAEARTDNPTGHDDQNAVLRMRDADQSTGNRPHRAGRQDSEGGHLVVPKPASITAGQAHPTQWGEKSPSVRPSGSGSQQTDQPRARSA